MPLITSSHIAAKCHSSAPASQSPSAIWRGKCETEQRRGVVDLPARADHHQHRERVDPVRHAHPARMDDGAAAASRRHGGLVGGFDGHGIGPIGRPYSKSRAQARSHSCHASSTPAHGGVNAMQTPLPRVRGDAAARADERRTSHRQQHGVDDVDDAVRLQHVGDRHHGDVALGVGDGELAGAGLLDGESSPATVLSLACPRRP